MSKLDHQLYRLSLGILGYKLFILGINALTFPSLRPGKTACKSAVSILVPARNEAHNLRRTLPLLLQQGAAEVLVLDDHSSDETASVAGQLGAQVISGAPLPAGWTGKNWACWQLAQAAQGEILLFTDADVDWHAGALEAVLASLHSTQADLLSVWPRQHNESMGERLLTPLLDDLLLCWFAAPLNALPQPDASAGNGQLMAFRRDAYFAIGGHVAVADQVLEDVALARTVKAKRKRLAVALGGDFLSVRMYDSYPNSLEGIAKIALPFHRGWRWALPLSWMAHLLVYSFPWAKRWPLPVGLSLVEAVVVRLLTGRTKQRDMAEIAFTPFLPILALPVYWRASQRKLTWKGRSY